jgi:WhiB family redox-sensing transcriptional regulator
MHQQVMKNRRRGNDRAMVGSTNSWNWREPGWYSDAACRSQVSSRWFSHDRLTRAAALTVCHNCPVETECLALALEHPEVVGIWGGTEEAQRVRLRRDLRRRNRAARERIRSATSTPTP